MRISSWFTGESSRISCAVSVMNPLASLLGPSLVEGLAWVAGIMFSVSITPLICCCMLMVFYRMTWSVSLGGYVMVEVF